MSQHMTCKVFCKSHRRNNLHQKRALIRCAKKVYAWQKRTIATPAPCAFCVTCFWRASRLRSSEVPYVADVNKHATSTQSGNRKKHTIQNAKIQTPLPCPLAPPKHQHNAKKTEGYARGQGRDHNRFPKAAHLPCTENPQEGKQLEVASVQSTANAMKAYKPYKLLGKRVEIIETTKDKKTVAIPFRVRLQLIIVTSPSSPVVVSMWTCFACLRHLSVG